MINRLTRSRQFTETCAAYTKTLTAAFLGVTFAMALPPLAYGEIAWQPQLVSYRPLEILIPAEQIKLALDQQLASLTGTEFNEKNVRFRFENVHSELLGNGRLLIRSDVHARHRLAIVGTVRGQARARIWIDVAVHDWKVHLHAVDSDIKFSNDLINLAFQIVRPHVEKQLVELASESLEPLNQKISPGSNFTVQLLHQRGRLDGSLEQDGLRAVLRAR